LANSVITVSENSVTLETFAIEQIMFVNNVCEEKSANNEYIQVQNKRGGEKEG